METEDFETVVQLLLSNDCVDVNSRDINGRTLLSWVAGVGNLERVKLLVAKDDIDRDMQDFDGRTPLTSAAMSGYVEIVELLLENNNKPVN